MTTRPFLMVLWAVFALAGPVLGGSAAQAHSGHLHHQAIVHDHAPHKAVAVPSDSVRDHDARSAEVTAELSNAPASDLPNMIHPPCNCPSCAAGSCCCTSAVNPVPATFGPPHPRGLTMTIRAGPTILGIDPEALPEPPKSFA